MHLLIGVPLLSTAAELSYCYVFDRWHPSFWDFDSTVPVDFVKVKSYVDCLFHLACIEMGITIDKLYFIPERAVYGIVSVL